MLGATQSAMAAVLPHCITVDRDGNIFVGELSGRTRSRFSQDPPPKRIRVLHKLEKIAA
jgi:hypothetical protein